MSGLRDYSGEFNPNIKLEDFSKEALIGLLELYSRLFLAVDGFWYLAVKGRVSNEEALSCDMWVWEREIKYEMDRLVKLLRIQGNDVVALMKALQMSPWFSTLGYNIKTIGRNGAVLTVTYCPILTAMEKEGEGREKTFCKSVEPLMFKMYANYFNPDIEIKPLNLPPGKSKREICCQWEFKVE